MTGSTVTCHDGRLRLHCSGRRRGWFWREGKRQILNSLWVSEWLVQEQHWLKTAFRYEGRKYNAAAWQCWALTVLCNWRLHAIVSVLKEKKIKLLGFSCNDRREQNKWSKTGKLRHYSSKNSTKLNYTVIKINIQMNLYATNKTRVDVQRTEEEINCAVVGISKILSTINTTSAKKDE